jgi:hypothetical protein
MAGMARSASREDRVRSVKAGRRRWGSSVVIAPEIAEPLTAGGEVYLGEWSEPELLAAGFLHVNHGDPNVPEASSSFTQLDDGEQDRQVSAALDDLVSRGLVRRTGEDTGTGEPVAGTTLDLVGAVVEDFVFRGAWTIADSAVDAGACLTAASVYGVRIPPTGWMAVLDERIDMASSSHAYTLRSPENYVALVAREVFGDVDPPVRPEDESARTITWNLVLMWAKGPVRREAQWMAVRPTAESWAALVKLRTFGLRRKDNAQVTEDEFHRDLADVFAEVCAAEPAPLRA